MATIKDLTASILKFIHAHFQACGLKVSPPDNGQFEVFASSIADCQKHLVSGAKTHPRVPWTLEEGKIDASGREGIYCDLVIAAPDPDSGDVDLDDNEHIEVQVFSEGGRILVEISVN